MPRVSKAACEPWRCPPTQQCPRHSCPPLPPQLPLALEPCPLHQACPVRAGRCLLSEGEVAQPLHPHSPDPDPDPAFAPDMVGVGRGAWKPRLPSTS